MDFEEWWETFKRSTYAQMVSHAGEERAKAIASEAWFSSKGEDLSARLQGESWFRETCEAWFRSKGEDLSARLQGESWFRETCAVEMGVDAPGGEASHPLRDWLQELKVLRMRGDSRVVERPQWLLQALKECGGSLAALAEAGLIALSKGQDYNDTAKAPGEERDKYFPLGLASYAQMIHVKAQRLISFAGNSRAAKNEGVRDTLLDLINYASFGADWLKRQEAKTKEGGGDAHGQ